MGWNIAKKTLNLILLGKQEFQMFACFLDSLEALPNLLFKLACCLPLVEIDAPKEVVEPSTSSCTSIPSLN